MNELFEAQRAGLAGEVARMKEVGERLRRMSTWWKHGDECPKSCHDECCPEGEGWYCEQGDDREECETRTCDCDIDKMKGLIDELLGDDEQGRIDAKFRVDRNRDMLSAIKTIGRDAVDVPNLGPGFWISDEDYDRLMQAARLTDPR